MKIRILKLLPIVLVPFLLSGCIFIGAGLLASHEMKKSREEGRKSEYAKYRIESDKNNTEREEHNLPPVHTMTFQEWSTGTAATNTPAK